MGVSVADIVTGRASQLHPPHAHGEVSPELSGALLASVWVYARISDRGSEC
jgi:hypothetical protein